MLTHKTLHSNNDDNKNENFREKNFINKNFSNFDSKID